jgi:transposase
MGDDLFSRQPICEAVLAAGAHFLFVCKPTSHPAIEEFRAGVVLDELKQRAKRGRHWFTYRYQWMNGVPLRGDEHAMTVNWLMIEMISPAGKVTHRNSFITDLPVDRGNVVEMAACGAARWKACPPTCWGGRPHGIACQTWVSSQHPGPEPPMTQYKRIAIDTSKSVFTLHCINQSDLAVLRTNLRRAQMIPFFKKISPTEIAMEACGAAHYWARELTALGHKVRLIPPQYVKPFVKRGKNDRNDAAAICEAAGRPAIHPVPVKTVEQQAQGMVLKIRQTLIGQRVQLTNALRGHAAEFGLVVAKGDSQISRLLFAIEQETAIPPEAKDMLVVLDEQIAHLNSQIKELDVKLAAAHKANPVSRNLATAPGIGPVIGLTMAAKVDPDVFASGRHFAAWVGLAPKEHSTGGKQRMGGISKQGDEGLRALFVNGATAVINAALRPGSKQMTDWLRGMLARKPKKLVAVALANKMARRAWAMMKSSKPYRHPAVPALAVAA